MATNNNINNIDFLFIWRNVVLRKAIIEQLNLFKDNYKAVFNTRLEYLRHNHKEYITEIIFNNGFQPAEIPSCVRKLTLKGGTTLYGIEFLDSLEALIFAPTTTSVPIRSSQFPISLKELVLSGEFNSSLNVGDLPNVHTLIFKKYDKTIGIGVLPNSLQVLKMGIKFNKPFSKGVIPLSVKTLHFGYCYDRRLKEGVLHQNIEHLDFGSFYQHPLNQSNVPSSVKTIRLPQFYNTKLLNLPNSYEKIVIGPVMIIKDNKYLL
ncbi:hypothetical protein DICPUDRAFT_149266 [Dictyostelium purpureum]|uniref:FNIP repeat-containing protein n=1 Tax=Dictyostelium purpureum TaxID=5786 RepID=F0ZD89_DICPU|nr:uncharacterized protein DICPUDRAFT_149266 [Dictyostelium purpureum]EGC38095.1 hypothetical protein DICPUDRAFT_149266 [Dictyostelium purpureum]|eukprot:XP_003285402.1 hypothetical protein DICPUDRAFT_149266 [Dictyostelium purpureum]